VGVGQVCAKLTIEAQIKINDKISLFIVVISWYI